jgi:hypothetical protein
MANEEASAVLFEPPRIENRRAKVRFASKHDPQYSGHVGVARVLFDHGKNEASIHFQNNQRQKHPSSFAGKDPQTFIVRRIHASGNEEFIVFRHSTWILHRGQRGVFRFICGTVSEVPKVALRI